MPKTTTCQRCGFGPLASDEGNPDAIILRRAKHTGVCVSCGITLFIKSIPSMMMGINRNGVEMLRDGAMAESWRPLLLHAHADVTLEEIDWNRVVDNWNLPDRRKPGRQVLP